MSILNSIILVGVPAIFFTIGFLFAKSDMEWRGASITGLVFAVIALGLVMPTLGETSPMNQETSILAHTDSKYIKVTKGDDDDTSLSFLAGNRDSATEEVVKYNYKATTIYYHDSKGKTPHIAFSGHYDTPLFVKPSAGVFSGRIDIYMPK